MTVRKSVVVDCFPESAARYRDGYAVVAIDVIRSTTMAISAAAAGRRCFPVPTLEAAHALARKLDNPILAGELAGDVPDGFEMNNSPVDLAARKDIHRPLILLSSSGSQLIWEAGQCESAYLACFRNSTALTNYLAGRHRRIAVIGAGSRGEFREEDQICCAWIAGGLMSRGYEPQDEKTAEIAGRWRNAPLSACLPSNSVRYLRKTGQLKDLDFIFAHLDDLDSTFVLRNGEVDLIPAIPEIAIEAGKEPAERVFSAA
jgi:2-phosphosulfolactate phosphatase